MLLHIRRGKNTNGCNISPLQVDGVYHSWVLEDVIREDGRPVEQWKVKGATAIPAGEYTVTVTPSQRFNRDLPLVNNVPGFAGIRFHPGNCAADTEGCLLPGFDKYETSVGRSRLAFEQLFERIQAAIAKQDVVLLTIENPGIP